MTIAARLRGHAVAYVDGVWRTVDGQIADPNADCAHCGKPPTPEGHDACIETLPGVSAACCGHGVEADAYVVRDDHCEACPFAAAGCGCEWGGKVPESHRIGPVSGCGGSVGTDTGEDVTGAQRGAQRIEGDQ